MSTTPQNLIQQTRSYDPKLYLALQNMMSDINSLSTSSGGVVLTGAGIAIYPVSLTGGGTVTVSISVPSGASILFVIAVEDSVGGTQIAWNSNFSSNTPTNINTLANAVSVFIFIGPIGGKWQYAGSAL